MAPQPLSARTVPSRSRGPRPELMDQSSLSAADTERALLDLQRVNRWAFGIGPAVRTLRSLIARAPRRQRLLDLGTGTGQVPSAVARSVRRRGILLQVVGTDRKLNHLLVGRRQGFAQLRVVADADQLPFRDGSVDWTMSNLLFHHFGPADNRRILSEMWRVARRGAVVVDLRSSRTSSLLVGLLLRVLRVDYVARYDGRVSVEEAWGLQEVREFAGEQQTVELRRRFPFRFSLVLKAHSSPG